jgi:hypothetical protein
MSIKSQQGTRAGTVARHIEAFRDLASNPGKYSQSDWTYKHHIGNRSATSAIKMGIIERRNGLLHFVSEAHINSSLIRKVLGSNANKRRQEKAKYDDGLAADPRTERFYELLPDLFTTKEAMKVAERVGIPKTTMQRIFRKDNRFYRIRHGTYCKDTAVINYDRILTWEDANTNPESARFYASINNTPAEPTLFKRPIPKDEPRVGLIRSFIRWIW